MAISDLYPTGLHEQNVGHFATIVRLALRDDKIDEDEHKLLKRLAKRLDITKSEFKTILNSTTSDFTQRQSFCSRFLSHFCLLSLLSLSNVYLHRKRDNSGDIFTSKIQSLKMK